MIMIRLATHRYGWFCYDYMLDGGKAEVLYDQLCLLLRYRQCCNEEEEILNNALALSVYSVFVHLAVQTD